MKFKFKKVLKKRSFLTTIVLFFATFNLLLNFSKADEKSTNKYSPEIKENNWDLWYPLQNCNNNSSYVKGVRILNDNFLRAMNESEDSEQISGLVFYCGKNEGILLSESKLISEFGMVSSKDNMMRDYDNERELFCNKGYAIGFQMKFGNYQINESQFKDNANANATKKSSSLLMQDKNISLLSNFRIICSNEEKEEKIEDEWTSQRMCGENQALCGAKFLLSHLKNDSLAGIKDIKMRCCNLPNLASSCRPTDRWEILLDVDNRNGLQNFQYSYTKRVGVEIHPERNKSGGPADYKLDMKYLRENFEKNLNYSNATKFNWKLVSRETWMPEDPAKKLTPIEIEIKANVHTIIYQIVGICGDIFTVYPNTFYRKDIPLTTRAPNFNNNANNNDNSQNHNQNMQMKNSSGSDAETMREENASPTSIQNNISIVLNDPRSNASEINTRVTMTNNTNPRPSPVANNIDMEPLMVDIESSVEMNNLQMMQMVRGVMDTHTNILISSENSMYNNNYNNLNMNMDMSLNNNEMSMDNNIINNNMDNNNNDNKYKNNNNMYNNVNMNMNNANNNMTMSNSNMTMSNNNINGEDENKESSKSLGLFESFERKLKLLLSDKSTTMLIIIFITGIFMYFS